jgi:hypothetical protein
MIGSRMAIPTQRRDLMAHTMQVMQKMKDSFGMAYHRLHKADFILGLITKKKKKKPFWVYLVIKPVLSDCSLSLGTIITNQGYVEQKEYLHIFHESLVTISSLLQETALAR